MESPGSLAESSGRTASADPRPRLREDVLVRCLESDVVVYDPANDHTTVLNAPAAVVLLLCDGTRTAADIALQVGGVFTGGPHEIAERTAATLRELLASGLLVT